jgi:hypothetical protein
MFRAFFLVLTSLGISTTSVAQGSPEQCEALVTLPTHLPMQELENWTPPKGYTDCKIRNARRRLGLYSCFIEHAAGIQYGFNADAKDALAAWNQSEPPYVGAIRLSNNQFVLSISERVNRHDPNKSFFAINRSEREISLDKPGLNNSISPPGGWADYFFKFTDIAGSFELRDDNTFVGFRLNVATPNKYITQGRCELLR